MSSSDPDAPPPYKPTPSHPVNPEDATRWLRMNGGAVETACRRRDYRALYDIMTRSPAGCDIPALGVPSSYIPYRDLTKLESILVSAGLIHLSALPLYLTMHLKLRATRPIRPDTLVSYSSTLIVGIWSGTSAWIRNNDAKRENPTWERCLVTLMEFYHHFVPLILFFIYVDDYWIVPTNMGDYPKVYSYSLSFNLELVSAIVIGLIITLPVFMVRYRFVNADEIVHRYGIRWKSLDPVMKEWTNETRAMYGLEVIPEEDVFEQCLKSLKRARVYERRRDWWLAWGGCYSLPA